MTEYAPSFYKKLQVDVYGDRYDCYQTLDRRWYYSINNGKVKKTSGNNVKTLVWQFGDRAQREEERLERQQLFERLQQKRQRQRQQQLEEFII